ncbi:MAG: DNA alkylation repair protein, partial [Oscillospiraceae bacterium]|nr:DNA alkylation repair protein [Oscillospiraceae bacterium]
MSICEEIRARLFELQDIKYRDFHAKLVPNIDPEKIIGVRTPALRKLAAELAKDERISEFLADIPHKFYDEMNLHGFIICRIKDYDACVSELDKLLPFVDNWATCDLISPNCFKKNPERLME